MFLWCGCFSILMLCLLWFVCLGVLVLLGNVMLQLMKVRLVLVCMLLCCGWQKNWLMLGVIFVCRVQIILFIMLMVRWLEIGLLVKCVVRVMVIVLFGLQCFLLVVMLIFIWGMLILILVFWKLQLLFLVQSIEKVRFGENFLCIGIYMWYWVGLSFFRCSQLVFLDSRVVVLILLCFRDNSVFFIGLGKVISVEVFLLVWYLGLLNIILMVFGIDFMFLLFIEWLVVLRSWFLLLCSFMEQVLGCLKVSVKWLLVIGLLLVVWFFRWIYWQLFGLSGVGCLLVQLNLIFLLVVLKCCGVFRWQCVVLCLMRIFLLVLIWQVVLLLVKMVSMQ